MLNLEAIRSVELFAGLSEEELGRLYQMGKAMSYQAGSMIVREGAGGGMLHVILEGEVEVRKKIDAGNDRALALLHAGMVFGEMSLFDGLPYSASVAAKTETQTLSLFRGDFITLAQAQPGLAFKVTANLIKTLSAKLRKTNENLVSLSLLMRQG